MLDALCRDERAIEGLPIRLAIALVVGVASLGVMMSTISGLGSLGVSELDTRPQPEIVGPGNHTVDVAVVDSEGGLVANTTVIATSGTAQLDGVRTARTNRTGVASLTLDPQLGPNQQEGTVALDVKPTDDSYADRRENTAIQVVDR
jgi:hypothetical protein